MTVKAILTSLRGDEMDSRCLAVAGGFAQRFHAHLVALHVEPDPMTALSSAMFDVGGGTGFTDQLIHSLEHENEVRRTAVKKAYSDWRVRAEVPEAVAVGEALNESSELVLKMGAERTILDYALASDLVVVALAEKGKDEGNLELEVALIDAGRPVIALPRNWSSAADDAPIVVAWNSSAEAAHALSASLPLLQDATRVVVLHAGRNDNASSLDSVLSYLAWHGIRAQSEELGAEANPEVLIAKRVSDLGARLLVMGGYTHSRAREFVFGGVTNHMLKTTRVPLLLAH